MKTDRSLSDGERIVKQDLRTGLAEAFELAHLDLMEYGIAFGLAILIIPIVEIIKVFQRKFGKQHN